MLWGSNKFFGYYPANVSFVNIIADVFGNTFHTPGFCFAVSPSHTELENVMVDWTAKALGLPQKFLLRNRFILKVRVLPKKIIDKFCVEISIRTFFRASVRLSGEMALILSM